MQGEDEKEDDDEIDAALNTIKRQENQEDNKLSTVTDA